MEKQKAVRLPKPLLQRIAMDMKREATTASAVIRRILLQHYGLLNGDHSAR